MHRLGKRTTGSSPIWPWFVVLVAAVLALVWIGYNNTSTKLTSQGGQISSQGGQISSANGKINNLSSAVVQNSAAAHALQQALAQANSEATKHGGTAIPTPSLSIVAPTGAAGPAGAPGKSITLAQAKLAVASLCAQNACAPKITEAQALQAMSTYCDSTGKCRGPKGAPGASGSNGSNGANGTDGGNGQDGKNGTNGADGPPPTPDQVLGGVETYCNANNLCQGPKGDKGDPGEPPFDLTITIVGVPYTCSRKDPFDPATPSYDCEPNPIIPVPSSS